jgi:hypothetical protein
MSDLTFLIFMCPLQNHEVHEKVKKIKQNWPKRKKCTPAIFFILIILNRKNIKLAIRYFKPLSRLVMTLLNLTIYNAA